MFGSMLTCIAILASDAHQEAATDNRGRATGSPSNATATVSPTTVAQATDRTDTLTSTTGVDLSIGSTIAGGNFGTASETRVWTTAVGARYTIDNLRLSVSLPYMRVRSNGVILTGIDSTPVVVAPGSGRRVVSRGLGDITLGGSYTVPVDSAGVEFELSGRVKLPTASKDSNLSTKKTDYSTGLQITKPLGRFAPFVSGTYRIFGDTQRFDLRNGFAGSIGTSAVFKNSVLLLASYHYADKATKLVSNAHELFVGTSVPFAGRSLLLTTYLTKGLSSGAADLSGGIGLSLRI